MNLNDALQFLGLHANSAEDQRFSAYQSMRERLEDKLAKAPTEGLKQKYRDGLLQMDEAIEAVENRADEEALPLLGSRSTPPQPTKAVAEPVAVPAPLEHVANELPHTQAPAAGNTVVATEQSAGKKAVFWMLSLASLSGAAYFGNEIWANDGGGWHWVGLVVAAFFALGLWMETLPDKSSDCPECGSAISIGLDETAICANCMAYVRVEGDSISLMPVDTVAEEHSFKVAQPVEFHWPNRCCLCAEAPTRMLEVSIESSHTGRNLLLGAAGLAVGALVVRRGGGYSGSVEVPHCDRCEGGMILEHDDDEFFMLFRSYSYYRDFGRVNELGSAHQQA